MREVADFELTRFGCYFTFQNGDPRKQEIARAQAYFAVKAREAEVSQQTAVTGDGQIKAIPRHFEEALLALVEAERDRKREIKAREAGQAYAKELEPKARCL